MANEPISGQNVESGTPPKKGGNPYANLQKGPIRAPNPPAGGKNASVIRPGGDGRK